MKRSWNAKTGVITMGCIFHTGETPTLRIWPSGFFKCKACDKQGMVGDHEELGMVFNKVQHMQRERAGQMTLF